MAAFAATCLPSVLTQCFWTGDEYSFKRFLTIKSCEEGLCLALPCLDSLVLKSEKLRAALVALAGLNSAYRQRLAKMMHLLSS